MTVRKGELTKHLRSVKGQVQTLYMDPPYFSQKDYRNRDGDLMFSDKWENRDQYLGWMKKQISDSWSALQPTGAFFLHVDPTASHYLKIICDQVFGDHNFANEIVWGYTKSRQAATRKFVCNHDIILFYWKDTRYHRFNIQYKPLKENTLKSYKKDSKGYYKEFTEKGKRVKRYAHHFGQMKIGSWWDDIPSLGTATNSREKTGYPTQKPERLLERLILATSNEGDLVADPMCGSGTTLVVAKKLRRQYFGCDISAAAVKTARERLGSTVVPPLDQEIPF